MAEFIGTALGESTCSNLGYYTDFVSICFHLCVILGWGDLLFDFDLEFNFIVYFFSDFNLNLRVSPAGENSSSHYINLSVRCFFFHCTIFHTIFFFLQVVILMNCWQESCTFLQSHFLILTSDELCEQNICDGLKLKKLCNLQ